MSFLYQALIKEQQKGQADNSKATVQPHEPIQASRVQSSIPQQVAFNLANQTAVEQKNTSHWFWLVIAGLLMLVGLLAGYLFATKTTTSPAEQQLFTNIQQQAQLNTQLMQELMQEKPQQLEQNVSLIEQSTVKPEGKTQQQDQLTQEKQIAVAVDEDGQLQTQVQSTEQQNNSEGEPLARTVLEELPITEIPDTLKSSFESAVKATEQKLNPTLFETQVSAGSSLPLITELPLSETYWVPDIEYQMHIYASQASERWIRINDQTLTEGEAFIDNLTLLEIRQDQIIWQSNNKRFSQNALEDFVKQ